jgi:hypothetical protein
VDVGHIHASFKLVVAMGAWTADSVAHVLSRDDSHLPQNCDSNFVQSESGLMDRANDSRKNISICANGSLAFSRL